MFGDTKNILFFFMPNCNLFHRWTYYISKGLSSGVRNDFIYWICITLLKVRCKAPKPLSGHNKLWLVTPLSEWRECFGKMIQLDVEICDVMSSGRNRFSVALWCCAKLVQQAAAECVPCRTIYFNWSIWRFKWYLKPLRVNITH